MTRKEAALQYASWGLPVLPCWWIEGGICACGDPSCRSPGKHPIGTLATCGLHSATPDELVVNAWWDTYPQANIAIRTGSGYAVLDIDPRHGGDNTLRIWEQSHGVLPEGLTALTGGGGYHRWFVIPPGAAIPSRANVLGPGVDIRADGGYVMAPPSNHLSCIDYAWDVDHHPEDGCAPAEMPAALLAALQVRKERPAVVIPEERLSPEKVAEIRSALAFIPSDDRDTWVEIGQSLQSTRAGEQALGLWLEWSQTSEKFDPKDASRVWRSFKPDHGRTLSSLYFHAKRGGWVEPFAMIPVQVVQEAPGSTSEDEDDRVPPPVDPATAPPPDHLLRLPGPLGEFLDYYAATCQQEQPQFAVQAALALGSVCLGRMWTTNRNQWPSLYLVCVGETGAGKEHVKTAIEQVLLEAGLTRQILGGSGYTSEGAVYTALRAQPCHLSIQDEFGIILEANKDSRNHNAHGVRRKLMEAIGRCHAAMPSQVYSEHGLSAEQKEKVKQQEIYNPAITLLGMTTPGTFYKALSSGALEDGFLGRLIIVQSHRRPTLGRDPMSGVALPQDLIAWAKYVRKPVGVIPVHTQCSVPATPRVVPFSEGAYAYSREFAQEVLDWREQLRSAGSNKETLLVRTREFAMRIALILAVAQDPVQPLIREHDVRWAADYVRHYAAQTVYACEAHMADSRWEGVCLAIQQGLRAAGSRGVSLREMAQQSPFRSIDPQDRKKALVDLEGAGLALKRTTNQGKPGRPGERWFSPWHAPAA